MADYEKALRKIIKVESGYVNDRDDPGCETKFGVSKRIESGENKAGLVGPIKAIKG